MFPHAPPPWWMVLAASLYATSVRYASETGRLWGHVNRHMLTHQPDTTISGTSSSISSSTCTTGQISGGRTTPGTTVMQQQPGHGSSADGPCPDRPARPCIQPSRALAPAGELQQQHQQQETEEEGDPSNEHCRQSNDQTPSEKPPPMGDCSTHQWPWDPSHTATPTPCPGGGGKGLPLLPYSTAQTSLPSLSTASRRVLGPVLRSCQKWDWFCGQSPEVCAKERWWSCARLVVYGIVAVVAASAITAPLTHSAQRQGCMN